MTTQVPKALLVRNGNALYLASRLDEPLPVRGLLRVDAVHAVSPRYATLRSRCVRQEPPAADQE